jgi:hypothetical protein
LSAVPFPRCNSYQLGSLVRRNMKISVIQLSDPEPGIMDKPNLSLHFPDKFVRYLKPDRPEIGRRALELPERDVSDVDRAAHVFVPCVVLDHQEVDFQVSL